MSFFLCLTPPPSAPSSFRCFWSVYPTTHVVVPEQPKAFSFIRRKHWNIVVDIQQLTFSLPVVYCRDHPPSILALCQSIEPLSLAQHLYRFRMRVVFLSVAIATVAPLAASFSVAPKVLVPAVQAASRLSTLALNAEVNGANGAVNGDAKKKVMVLGGDGFCGWPTSLYLSDQGHDIVIVDNLSRRKIDLDLGCDSLTPIASMEVRHRHRPRPVERLAGNECLVVLSLEFGWM